MEYLEVTVITPNNLKYKAEINPKASDEAILSGLIRDTSLPLTDEDGKPIKYRLDTVGATKLRAGGTLRIEIETPPAVKRVTRIP